jgi:TldD protein
VVNLRSQPDFASGKVNHTPSVSDSESFGFGVRVLADGAWGFAASYIVKQDEIARAVAGAIETAKANASLRRRPVLAPVPAYVELYRTPIAKDPFEVPIPEKLELLRSIADETKKVAGVFSVVGFIAQRMEHRYFASTDGSRIEQFVYQISPEFSATAVEKGKKQKSRTFRPDAVTAGYEAVERANMLGEARRVGEEAVAHLKAPSVKKPTRPRRRTARPG